MRLFGQICATAGRSHSRTKSSHSQYDNSESKNRRAMRGVKFHVRGHPGVIEIKQAGRQYGLSLYSPGRRASWSIKSEIRKY